MPELIHTRLRRLSHLAAFCLFVSISLPASGQGDTHLGYYRFPAVHGDTIVFTSEGDLWSVSTHGGSAHRVTTSTGRESMAAISPDGNTVAFLAEYEGPAEVYTMPVSGGLPQRQSWDGDTLPEGWTPDGRLLVSARRYSTLPDPKLVLLDLHGGREIVPLSCSGARQLLRGRPHPVLYSLCQAVQLYQAIPGRLGGEHLAL
jgi:tricorn protease